MYLVSTTEIKHTLLRVVKVQKQKYITAKDREIFCNLKKLKKNTSHFKSCMHKIIIDFRHLKHM